MLLTIGFKGIEVYSDENMNDVREIMRKLGLPFDKVKRLNFYAYSCSSNCLSSSCFFLNHLSIEYKSIVKDTVADIILAVKTGICIISEVENHKNA